MAIVTTRVEGLRELDRALGQLPKATAKNTLRRVLRKAAKPIADDMRRLAPNDPSTGYGDLESAIAVSTKSAKHARTRKADRSLVEIYIGVSTDPEFRKHHSVYPEFGTVDMPPQPFARPAWDGNKARTLDTIEDDLGDEIMKAAKRLARKQAKAARG